MKQSKYGVIRVINENLLAKDVFDSCRTTFVCFFFHFIIILKNMKFLKLYNLIKNSLYIISFIFSYSLSLVFRIDFAAFSKLKLFSKSWEINFLLFYRFASKKLRSTKFKSTRDTSSSFRPSDFPSKMTTISVLLSSLRLALNLFTIFSCCILL